MSRIIPFAECIARPDMEQQRFYLKDHLEGVRNLTHSFFKNQKFHDIEIQLLELAAISHDIGKANWEWQEYIVGRINKGPSHSECGAIFFSYIGYHFLHLHAKWDEYKELWLQMTRDIADHHGELKSLMSNEELEKGSFSKMDMEGIKRWIDEQYPIFADNQIAISVFTLEEWRDGELQEVADDTLFDLNLEKRKQKTSLSMMMDMLQKWRFLTTVLISSDRFDINFVRDERITQADWLEIQRAIVAYCEQGEQKSLDQIRSKAQEDILNQWKKAKAQRYYVLEMPTGYGKTVTSLKLATEIGKERGQSKIIYVAPYLSILEQNAEAIEKATNRLPLQHHSMAILNHHLLDENAQTDNHSTLHMQAWGQDIVCTSFVQWMRAIFPRRAQETIRRAYLNDAIVIIDEPQIIDASVWNLFLVGLESLMKRYNLTIIFCSATMPPFYKQLEEKPTRLSIMSRKEDNRYYIQVVDKQTKESCAHKLIESREQTAIAILNTIKDAIDVYDELSQYNESENYLLHGLMIPIHKSIQINRINQRLQSERVKPIRVVSTQVMEAGVDLSFHYMYRALPIIPSLVQAAGRVNRHNELKIGRIETSHFLRDESDTRYIYSPALRRITDDLLFMKERWYEHETADLVRSFYKKMFTENSYEAVLQDIQKAFFGNWSILSSHDVFKSDEHYRLPVFIPFEWEAHANELPEVFKTLVHEFEFDHSKEIYQVFLEKGRRASWSYEKNKRFMILFNQFVVNVPVKRALQFVPKEDFFHYRVPILEDSTSYDLEKGLKINDDISNVII